MKLLNIAIGIFSAVFMIGAVGAETRITYKSPNQHLLITKWPLKLRKQ